MTRIWIWRVKILEIALLRLYVDLHFFGFPGLFSFGTSQILEWMGLGEFLVAVDEAPSASGAAASSTEEFAV